MREERGQIRGDVVVYEEFTLWGSIGGNVTVIKGGKFYVRGIIHGDLVLENGGRVHVLGNVNGNVIVHPGAKLVHSGNIGGDVTNLGGRFYVNRTGTIAGKVKTISGETAYEKEPPPPEPADEFSLRPLQPGDTPRNRPRFYRQPPRSGS